MVERLLIGVVVGVVGLLAAVHIEAATPQPSGLILYRSTNINLDDLSGGWPSGSPSGTRVAVPDAKGPAGERIYTTKGVFLRNLVGDAAGSAFWSPDETQLLLQEQSAVPHVFSFKTKRLTSLDHDGPADLSCWIGNDRLAASGGG